MFLDDTKFYGDACEESGLLDKTILRKTAVSQNVEVPDTKPSTIEGPAGPKWKVLVFWHGRNITLRVRTVQLIKFALFRLGKITSF